MEKKPNKNEIVFMTGIMALFFLAATIHASIGVMLSSFIADYGLEYAEQGFCGTAESIGIISSIVLMAVMLRRIPKTRVMLIMTLLLALVLPLIGMKPPVYALLLSCYALFGLSYGIIDSLSSSLMSDLFPEESARKMSYMRAVYCLGGMISPLLLNALLERNIPWNRVALITGIIGIAICVYYFLFAAPRIPEVSSEQRISDRVSFKSYVAFLRIPGAVRTVLFGVMYYGHQIGLTMWIVRYITIYMGEPKWGAYGLTFFWIGAFLSRIILPRLIKTHRTLLLYGNLTAAILLGIGVLIGNGKLFCFLVFLDGFAEGTTIPMLVDYACSLDRSRSAVACSSVCFFNNIGSLFVPSLIGTLISLSGAKTGIFILPVTSLMCVLLAYKMRKD